MRWIEFLNKYESRVLVADETKSILKLSCQCYDFINRRIHKSGKFANIKYYSEPCKHVRPIVEALQKQGYTIKKPTNLEGSDKLTEEIKKALMKLYDNQCSFGDCEETEGLCFHRINRGNSGGKYSLTNTIPLCAKHHKLVHSYEFR